jgi:predicted DNA-binding transcriptional regulator AlpA
MKLFYTRTELAELLGVHVNTITKHMQTGAIPPPLRTSQRTLRWSKKRIDEWIDNSHKY